MPEVLEQPAHRRPGMFTAETARKAAALSVAARLAAAQRPPVEPAPAQATAQAVSQTVPTDDFTVRKLARVRDQIERVESLLDDADEPQAVDRFANALTRLYDLERILAGRPLPGSRRPAADKPSRQRGPSSVLVDEAQDAAVFEQPSAVVPARPMGWEYDEPSKQG